MITIIIPVYNGEKNIKKTIESIQKQTYTEYELLVINDGSKDDTGNICKRLSEIDQRIKYYEFENHGVSWARNKGIELANGEYIMFVDADDILKPNAIRILMQMKINNDLVVGGIEMINFLTGKKRSLKYKSGVYAATEYLALLDDGEMSPFFGGPYAKLFDTEKIRERNIRFIEEQSYAEDFCFNLDYLRYCQNICIVADEVYEYYFSNPNSLSVQNVTKLPREQLIQQQEQTYRHYIELMNSFNYGYNNKILFHMWMTYIAKMNYENKYSNVQRKDIIYNDLISHEVFRQVREIKGLGKRRKILSLLMVNRFGIFLICVGFQTRHRIRQISDSKMVSNEK